MAKLPDGTLVPAARIGTRVYGTDRIEPEEAFKTGIPVKGQCNDLLKHIGGHVDSAFRGTTARPVIDHRQAQGAVYWALEGGWVYELVGMPGWDVEQLLEGRVPVPGGFADSPVKGELECSVESRIPPERIRGASRVVKGRKFLEAVQWIENSNFRP